MSKKKPLVSIITATTANPLLKDCLESVNKQTYPNIQHLIFIDGPKHIKKYTDLVKNVDDKKIRNEVFLPYPTGIDRWNGHRMYAAGTYLSEGEYLMFLDDDNYLEPSHVEDCVNTMEDHDWVFSFRNIVDKDRKFICKDDCESLGLWPSVLNEQDYFVDVNCFFWSRQTALLVSPIWYRKFREPGVVEIDRALMQGLRQAAPRYKATKKYTVNYTVGNTDLSVKGDFFIQGNKKMLEKYNGMLPWKEPDNIITINI